MVNILQLELKLESKDQLLDAFGKTNPPAKKSCMYSCVFILAGQSCWVLQYSTLLLLLFSGNPIWPGVILDGWEIDWENDDEEWYAWMASCVYHAFSLMLSKTLDPVYFYVLKNLVCNIKYLWTCRLLCNVMMYSGPAFVRA
jgi:hypothetical protein